MITIFFFLKIQNKSTLTLTHIEICQMYNNYHSFTVRQMTVERLRDILDSDLNLIIVGLDNINAAM